MSKISPRTWPLRFAPVVAAILFVLPTIAGAESAERFKEVSRSGKGAIDWVTVHGDRTAIGSSEGVFVAGRRIELEFTAKGAALVDNRLYLTREDGLVALRLDSRDIAPTSVPLTPRHRGDLLVGRMTDHLVVAEDGFGLRLLALPPPAGMNATHAHHGPAGPQQVASFEMQQDITAIGASSDVIYVAANGELVAIDARDPSNLVETMRVAMSREVRALAANGSRLYMLDAGGLTVLDVKDPQAPSLEGTYPEVRGDAIHVAGRLLQVGMEDGLITLRDRSPLAATHFVTVGDFFFSPSSLTIDSGDTVQWDWNAVFPHNVESCDGSNPLPASSFCNAQAPAAEGTFISGAPTAAPFTFSKTFTTGGLNPYFCVLHVSGVPPFGMVGSVTVNATASPPGVPDTAPGMRVSKIDASGNTLRLLWDGDVCTGDCDHHVVHGVTSGLPGLSLTSSANQCTIGSSPYMWSSVPNPSPEPFLWFLVVADDCAATEGSWGQDSEGSERNGASASGQCGITDKDLQNVCGQ